MSLIKKNTIEYAERLIFKIPPNSGIPCPPRPCGLKNIALRRLKNG